MSAGSSVGIATGYWLDGPWIESRWGRDFPHLSRPALGAHTTSCAMRTGSFPGVKSGRGMKLTLHPFLLPWSRKSRAILLPVWTVRPVQFLSTCTTVHCDLPYMTAHPKHIVINCFIGRNWDGVLCEVRVWGWRNIWAYSFSNLDVSTFRVMYRNYSHYDIRIDMEL